MRIYVTPAERTVIVAALVAYGDRELANTIVGERSLAPEDDGPEIYILRRGDYDDQYTEGNGTRNSGD